LTPQLRRPHAWDLSDRLFAGPDLDCAEAQKLENRI
jgi:hypothetical protein